MTPVDRDREDVGAAAANALWAATQAVELALAGEESELAQALAGRERAFAALQGNLQEPLSAAALGLIARVVETDQNLVRRATAKIAEIRGEMAQSRRARGALKAFEPETRPARFVSERA